MSKPAVFVTGSIFRHVAVTAATGSIGLIAVFVVDVLNLFYISRLGVSELAAAVGFAGTLMFFTTSLAIGLTIPASAMVARLHGEPEFQRDLARARKELAKAPAMSCPT